MSRKKVETINSLDYDEDKLIVQKSLPLFALWQSDLTLAEFKILDAYLSKIDSHNPEKRVVVFEKGQLEKLLGVQKINNNVLEKRLKHLMENVVKIPNTDEKKGFRLISIFEEAVAEQDDYGIWQVKLECTQKAMKYIFNIENLGYLRYKIRCITSITSRYTYIMFMYLEANRFRMSWEVPLAKLKEILNCDKEETYKEFKRFNDRLLKRVQAEMYEKTECKYDYEPVKKGRSVVAVRFIVEPLSKASFEDEDIDSNQLTEEKQKYSSEALSFLADACDNGFSEEEMQVIFSKVVTKNLPSHQLDSQTALYHYLMQKYAELKHQECLHKIKDRFLYFKKMLDND